MRQLTTKDLSRWELDGIDADDYGDFCDAYISRAWDKNDVELTEDELEWLNFNDYDGVAEIVQDGAYEILADRAENAYDTWKDRQMGL